MANRTWRVAANFHRIGDVVVTVISPNWQGGLRKAALAIKALPQLKGKRLNMGSFMLQEVEPIPLTEVMANAQLSLPTEGQAQVEAEQTQPATTSEPEK